MPFWHPAAYCGVLGRASLANSVLSLFLLPQSLVVHMLCQAAKRASILEILKDPWVLKFQPEQPTNEIRLLEAMCQPIGSSSTTSNRHQSLGNTA